MAIQQIEITQITSTDLPLTEFGLRPTKLRLPHLPGPCALVNLKSFKNDTNTIRKSRKSSIEGPASNSVPEPVQDQRGLQHGEARLKGLRPVDYDKSKGRAGASQSAHGAGARVS